jgi:hypothetical protein
LSYLAISLEERDFAIDIARRVIKSHTVAPSSDLMTQYLSQGAGISEEDANAILRELVDAGELEYKYGTGFTRGESFVKE